MPINPTLIIMLMSSTIIVISSPSWFCMWMGIEINSMAFIPMMYNHNNKLPTESSLKYFLTQTFASMIMMIAIIMIMQKEPFPTFIQTPMLLSMAMTLKLGAAPFHMWYPPVVEGLEWTQNLILMSWQKIAPLFILWTSYSSKFLTFIIIASLIIGSISALNQSSIRKLLAYSSITHMSWIMAPMLISSHLWSTYMMIYFSTTIITILSFYINKIYYLFQMNLVSIPIFVMISINLLSMGGFPPLLGFIGKWVIINNLISNSSNLLPFLMILSSWLNLYIYLRILHPSFHIKMMKIKSNSSINKFNNTAILSMISSSSILFITPMM